MNSKPHYTKLREQYQPLGQYSIAYYFDEQDFAESWWKLDEHISKQKCDVI